MKCKIVFRFRPYTLYPQDNQTEFHELKTGSYLEAFRLLYDRYGDNVEGIICVKRLTN